MSNPTKPAWGSYADLKRIQREREQRDREKTVEPVAPVVPEAPGLAPEPVALVPERATQTGHPQTGHPDSGHPQTGHPDSGHPLSSIPGTQIPGTQSPKNRAPGHPDVGAQVPDSWVPGTLQTGHPLTSEPGTQNRSTSVVTPLPVRREPPQTDGAESPHWPSRQFKTRLNLRFPGDLAAQLDDYCRRQNISKQDAAEIAIRRLLAEDRTANRAPGHPQTGHPQTGHPVKWVPESGHDHDHEDEDRIIIYQQMTGNRVNARDRAAFVEVRHLHTDIIREGIRLSVERAPAPVKSFRYCLGAIFEVANRGTVAAVPAATPKRPVQPEPAPTRTYDESVLLARAVVRQLRHDRPGVADGDVREHVQTWAIDQQIANADSVLAAALAAENVVS